MRGPKPLNCQLFQFSLQKSGHGLVYGGAVSYFTWEKLASIMYLYSSKRRRLYFRKVLTTLTLANRMSRYLCRSKRSMMSRVKCSRSWSSRLWMWHLTDNSLCWHAISVVDWMTKIEWPTDHDLINVKICRRTCAQKRAVVSVQHWLSFTAAIHFLFMLIALYLWQSCCRCCC